MKKLLVSISLLMVTAVDGSAQFANDTAGYSSEVCPSCTEWNRPAAPRRLFANTYYVGTEGLASILITAPDGHILIDGGLPDSAPRIVANIRALGFSEKDIKFILNSHAHYDHAGGIAALVRMSGATAIVSPKSAEVLRTGKTGRDDPQHAIAHPYPAVSRVRSINEGDTVRLGDLELVAHWTPGHTPGGTSWSWRSCAQGRCLSFVYADSQTPVSADDFYFTRNSTYPHVISDFERGFRVLEQLPCDVLLTPHPGASNMWDRLAAKEGAALINPSACRRYVANARTALQVRLERERK